MGQPRQPTKKRKTGAPSGSAGAATSAAPAPAREASTEARAPPTSLVEPTTEASYAEEGAEEVAPPEVRRATPPVAREGEALEGLHVEITAPTAPSGAGME